MGEVEAADRGGRRHREALGERHAGAPGLEQIEERALLTVVRTGRIPKRRTDAAISLGDEVVGREAFLSPVPPLAPRARVQVFGERFGESIRKRLDHDRVVVVEVAFERPHELGHTVAGGHGEGADEVLHAAITGRHEVGERQVGGAAGHLLLLAEHVEAQQVSRCLGASVFRRRHGLVEHDVLALRVRGPEAVDAAGRDQPAGDNPVEERARVVVHLPCRGAVLRVIEDGGEASLQFPCGEEERPVDVRHEFLERHSVQQPRAGELRPRNRVAVPLEGQAVRPRRGPGKERALLERGVLLTDPLLFHAGGHDEVGLLRRAQQAGHDVDGPRRIEHVDDGLAEFLRDLDSGVLAAGGRATDQERDREAAPLHLARDEHHLIE